MQVRILHDLARYALFVNKNFAEAESRSPE